MDHLQIGSHQLHNGGFSCLSAKIGDGFLRDTQKSECRVWNDRYSAGAEANRILLLTSVLE